MSALCQQKENTNNKNLVMKLPIEEENFGIDSWQCRLMKSSIVALQSAGSADVVKRFALNSKKEKAVLHNESNLSKFVNPKGPLVPLEKGSKTP